MIKYLTTKYEDCGDIANSRIYAWRALGSFGGGLWKFVPVMIAILVCYGAIRIGLRSVDGFEYEYGLYIRPDVFISA